MDGKLENRTYNASLVDLEKRLKSMKGVGGDDPITKWKEDSVKIELLTKALDSLKQNPQLESDAIERITELLEVLRWKRCDLGGLLLQGKMSGFDEGQLARIDRKGSGKP